MQLVIWIVIMVNVSIAMVIHSYTGINFGFLLFLAGAPVFAYLFYVAYLRLKDMKKLNGEIVDGLLGGKNQPLGKRILATIVFWGVLFAATYVVWLRTK